MGSDSETIADIAEDMRSNEDCYGMWHSYAYRIEAAHNREVDALAFKLMVAKSEKMLADSVIIEQTNKVDKLERETEERSMS